MDINNQNTTSNDTADNHSLFALFKGKRFTPYFLTTFFGTFNDNFYKNALIYILTFQLLPLAEGIKLETFNNLSSAIFIIPYVFFSALAGQIADKYEKSGLIRKIKVLEICIMLTVAVGFFMQSLNILLLGLMMLGFQSAFFSPIKYSILPQHLHKDELTNGNGLIEMGNFSAIVIGTILAGLLLKLPFPVENIVITSTLLVATCGFIASRFIASASPSVPSLKLDFNIFRQTYKVLKLTRRDTHTFFSVMGISWFWFMGAFIMAQLSTIVKLYLYGDADVLNTFFVCFSIGIGIGAVMTAKLSHKRAELGLVVISNLGLAVVILALTGLLYGMNPLAENTHIQLLSFSEFFAHTKHVLILLCFLLLGFFGGMYEIPLITSLQERSPRETLARLFAANNICNAIGMVLSAVIAIVVLTVLKLPMWILFMIVLLMHCTVFFILTRKMPILVERFKIRFLKLKR